MKCSGVTVSSIVYVPYPVSETVTSPFELVNSVSLITGALSQSNVTLFIVNVSLPLSELPSLP